LCGQELNHQPSRIAHLQVATRRSALEGEAAHIQVAGLDKASLVELAGGDALHLDGEVICTEVHGSRGVAAWEVLGLDEAEEG
jgi:hypothetical protein